MASFDWEIVAGDTAPLFPDTLVFSNGQPANLAGATVTLVLRSLVSSAPLTLTGAVTIVSAALGQVQYAPSAQDTATAGLYMGSWVVQFATTQMTFPTEGYLSVRIQENLTSAGGEQLVSLPDVKDYLNIASSDRSRDAKLVRFIRAARPIVEGITGPIIPTVFSEWHSGGGPIIQVRRRPRTTYATTPVLDLLTVDEFIGSQQHPLTIVTDPGSGSSYSCMIDEVGTITRRTGGGGVGSFAAGPNIHVTYRAGQTGVPANVYEGTLELLRVNYETTQSTGSGLLTQADQADTGPPLGFFVPRRVRELLSPTGRAPSVA